MNATFRIGCYLFHVNQNQLCIGVLLNLLCTNQMPYVTCFCCVLRFHDIYRSMYIPYIHRCLYIIYDIYIEVCIYDIHRSMNIRYTSKYVYTHIHGSRYIPHIHSVHQLMMRLMIYYQLEQLFLNWVFQLTTNHLGQCVTLPRRCLAFITLLF